MRSKEEILNSMTYTAGTIRGLEMKIAYLTGFLSIQREHLLQDIEDMETLLRKN
jgi:hypothetical protein